MLYRPNFCCNCGEKIERTDWNLLTSRRFCAVCADEQKKHDFLPRAVVGGGVLALVFGMGTLIGGRSEPVPVRSLKESVSANKGDSAIKQEMREPPNTGSNQLSNTTPGGINEQLPNQKNTSIGTAYFCSAATKKGTPCSRRVKTAGGRCWQHVGKPAAVEEN